MGAENAAGKPQQGFELAGDFAPHGQSKCFDDDGRLKRSGSVLTASAHIITAVIGSGVLSLAWATAQLGWIAGPTVLFLFSFVTYYTSCLLSACYRSGDPVTGKRNCTYMEAVESNLGGFQVKLCGFIQYFNLVGVAIGYTIAASISMIRMKRSRLRVVLVLIIVPFLCFLSAAAVRYTPNIASPVPSHYYYYYYYFYKSGFN